MKTIKHVWPAMVRLIRRIGSLPETIAQAAKKRDQRADLNKREAERIDRICNPSKYLGK